MEDCDRAYFGINRTSDFPRALQCYQSEKRWDLLIVMSLNGEGTPADVARAEALLQEWEGGQMEGGWLEAQALRAAIEDRKQHQGTAYPRIDYCRDIARDTLTLNFCGYVDAEIAGRPIDQKAAEDRAVVGDLFDHRLGFFAVVIVGGGLGFGACLVQGRARSETTEDLGHAVLAASDHRRG